MVYPAVTSPATLTLAFVSSAYNEEENLEELHRRCRAVHAELQEEFSGRFALQFRFLVADNGSEDGSLDVLKDLIRHDPAVEVLVNRMNYGAEASAGNLLAQACAYDVSVFLCSDLQDPPETATSMVRLLLTRPDVDAVLAVKSQSLESLPLRLARRAYYRILGYSSRLQVVPSGFHGFGTYSRDVVEAALTLWNGTDLNFRQCLANATHAPVLFDYVQAPRRRGVSSYRGWGYWHEALRSLISADAAASRLALAIGLVGLLLAVLVGILLFINFLSGDSGYSGGVPTVMGLVLLSFAMQMLMFAVLSRQIESLRMGGLRRKVRFQHLSVDHG